MVSVVSVKLYMTRFGLGEAQTKTVSIYYTRCQFGFPNLIDDSIPNGKGAALVVELLPLSFY
jgi:hypothetical protein